jgi:spermidine dehydrogenase
MQRLLFERTDYLPGLNSNEKKQRLAVISYTRFLTDLTHSSEEVVKFYQTVPQPLFGVGIDAVSAQDAWGLGLPGFSGMKLDSAPGKGMNRDAIPNAEAEKYFFHFPDGNASIARLLVRKLIPRPFSAKSVTDDVVTARANYAKLR